METNVDNNKLRSPEYFYLPNNKVVGKGVLFLEKHMHTNKENKRTLFVDKLYVYISMVHMFFFW